MSQKNRDEKDSAKGIKFETAAASIARSRQEIDEHKDIQEALRESVLEMKTRNKILEIFHTTPDDQVYGELLELVLEVFNSKFGTFGYFDQEGHFVIPSMTREIYWQKCQVPDKEIIFKKGTFTGIWARAIKERKTLYSNDGPFKTPKGHIPITDTMVTPIIYHNRVISSIHLANKETDYDEGDRRLLETIADQIAPVLNARLQRDRLERERKQWEQAILRSEERLAQAQAIAHVGCWETDLNSQEEWWSDELYRIFAVDPGTFTPSRESVSKLIPAQDLAMISSLLELQAYSIKDPTAKSILSSTRQRIYSMALIHDQIYHSENLSSIDAREYFDSIITQLNKAYGTLQRLINIKVKVDNVPLPLAFAIPCGLILNELLTNAFKYAFPGDQNGEIIVEFHKNNNRFVLSVGDNGVGLPAQLDFSEAESMGLRLINILTQQLKGEINLDQSKGTLFKITFTAKEKKD